MKYGDYDNVTKDSKAIYDILDRQGNTLLLECIAERIGTSAKKFSIGSEDRTRLMDSIVDELKTEILDRI